MTVETMTDPETTADLQKMVTFRLSRLNAKVTAQAARILAESCGLSLMQWRIMVMVDSRGPITPAEIVRQTGFDKSQVSRSLKRMVADGLLSSEASPSDQRAHVIRLTDKGRGLYERGRPAMRARQARLIDSLTPTELETLFRAFDRLECEIDAMETPE